MSYDLSVYATAPLSFDELLALVRSPSGLDFDGEPTSDSDSLMVFRGARHAYCFTVDGPFEVEPEDVPEEVTALVIGSKAVYQVLVEGSEEASIPHAVKFARKLAKATGGAMLDEQTDELWPKAKGRRIAAPAGERVIDCVRVVFCYLTQDSPDDLPQIFLRLARKYLPEALPRRFGETQPYQGRLDRDGDQGFIDACEGTDRFGLGFVCSYPVGGGSYNNSADYDVGQLSLSLDSAVLTDPHWRDALQRFFASFASESGSFFASAEVLRDYLATRSGFAVSAETEGRTSGVIGGDWVGLQPYPHWWTWFGPDYLPLVSSSLKGNTEVHGDHLFHSWSEAPLNRDQITALLPDPSQPWVAAEIQSVRGLNGLLPAEIIPRRLGHYA